MGALALMITTATYAAVGSTFKIGIVSYKVLTEDAANAYIQDIAEIVGLNPVYFSVLFKNKTDMNFSAYLVHVRMEKAKEMLVETNETIAAIADRVGYKDSRYFSQIFTKMVGVKPALYRRLHS